MQVDFRQGLNVNMYIQRKYIYGYFEKEGGWGAEKHVFGLKKNLKSLFSTSINLLLRFLKDNC